MDNCDSLANKRDFVVAEDHWSLNGKLNAKWWANPSLYSIIIRGSPNWGDNWVGTGILYCFEQRSEKHETDTHI